MIEEEHIVQRPTYFRNVEEAKKATLRWLEETSQHKWDRLMYLWNAKSESREYNCQECKSAWDLGPIVHDHIWRAICLASTNYSFILMCKSCMERSLGRSITDEDQLELLWNVWRRSTVNE